MLNLVLRAEGNCLVCGKSVILLLRKQMGDIGKYFHTKNLENYLFVFALGTGIITNL
jgi:hypothetical protein